MTDGEGFLRRFHAARPGVTSAALARGGSYERLWSRVHGRRVLDLACGDRVMPGAVGIDLSRDELARATGQVAQARAQALPFADGSFDAAVCHMAFMLFDEPERVVGELARVLVPGATFHALLGGGPTADGDDAFHAFVRLLAPAPALGDPRAGRPDGWPALFAGWHDVVVERWPIELAGSFDEVWGFLGASYQLAEPEPVRAALREAFPTDPVPCTVVTYYVRVTRDAR